MLYEVITIIFVDKFKYTPIYVFSYFLIAAYIFTIFFLLKKRYKKFFNINLWDADTNRAGTRRSEICMSQKRNRITSYNVCYTKLLRIGQEHARRTRT